MKDTIRIIKSLISLDRGKERSSSDYSISGNVLAIRILKAYENDHESPPSLINRVTQVFIYLFANTCLSKEKSLLDFSTMLRIIYKMATSTKLVNEL